MKFSTIFLLLFFFSQVATSQSAPKEAMDSTYEDSSAIPIKYCLVIPSGKFLSRHIEVQIDYGQDTPLLKNSYIVNENGERRKFNSTIHALNYMNSLGWEIIETYSVKRTKDSFSTYYMMESNTEAQLPLNQ